MVEALAARPMVKGACVTGLLVRGNAIFARPRKCCNPRPRRISAIVPSSEGTRPSPAGKACRQHRVREARLMNRRRIAPGKQCGARRRTDRSGVEIGVAQPLVCQRIEIGCVDYPAERARRTEADIVDQYPHDIGGACRRLYRRGPIFLRFGKRAADFTLESLVLLRRERRGESGGGKRAPSATA